MEKHDFMHLAQNVDFPSVKEGEFQADKVDLINQHEKPEKLQVGDSLKIKVLSTIDKIVDTIESENNIKIEKEFVDKPQKDCVKFVPTLAPIQDSAFECIEISDDDAEKLIFSEDFVGKPTLKQKAKEFVQKHTAEMKSMVTEKTFKFKKEYYDKHDPVGKFMNCWSVVQVDLVALVDYLRNFFLKFNLSINFNVDYLFDLFKAIFDFYHTKSRLGLVMNVGLLVRAFFDFKINDYVEDIKNIINRFLKVLFKQKIKAEAEVISSDAMSMSNLFSTFLESKFVVAVKTFLLSLVSLRFFKKENADVIKKFIGKSDKPVCLVDAIQDSLNVVESYINVSTNIQRGDNLLDAILKSDPVGHYMKSTYHYLIEEKDVYVGEAVNFSKNKVMEGRRNGREFITELQNDLTRGKEIMERFKVPNSFKIQYHELQRIYRDVKLLVGKRNRKTPFGIILSGCPGSGKSTLLVHIYRTWCEHKGLVYTPDLVFDRAVKSKYWTNYDCLSHLILHYPEMGSLHQSIAGSKGDESLEELLCVLDSAPYYPEKAAVDEKGKEFAAAELVVIDCNDPNLNAHVTTNNPAAVRRRFLFVAEEVKEEYRISKTGALSADKIRPLGGSMDLWDFKVTRENAVDSKVSDTKYFTVNGKIVTDINGFTEILLKEFARHDAEQDLLCEVKSKDLKSYIKAEGMLVSTFNYFYWSTLCFSCFYLGFGLTFFGLGSFYVTKTAKKSWENFMESPLHWKHYIQISSYIFFSTLKVQWETTEKERFKEAARKVGKASVFGYYFIRSYWVKDEEYSKRKMAYVYESLRMGEALVMFLCTVTFVKVCIYLVKMIYPIFQISAEGNLTSSGMWKGEKAVEQIKSIESSTGCGFPDPAKRTEGSMDYEDVSLYHLPIMGDRTALRQDFETFKTRVEHNLRVVQVIGPREFKSNALGICSDLLIMNKHCILDFDNFLLRTSFRDYGVGVVNSQITKEDWVDIGDDLILVRARGNLFRDIVCCFADFDTKVTLPGFFNGKEVSCKPLKGKYSIAYDNNKRYFDVFDPLEYRCVDHKIGFCGLPLFGRQENYSFVYGIHMGGLLMNGYATPVHLSRLQSGIAELTNVNHFQIVSEGELRVPVDTRLAPLKKKCPILFESCQSLAPIGCIEPFPTYVEPSSLIVSPMLPALEDILGESPYRSNGNLKFGPPLMRSKTINGVYTSPLNNWIKKVGVEKRSLATKINLAVEIALTMHLQSGLSGAGVVRLQPYPLSVAQNGYPKNFFIRGMNNGTSAGVFIQQTKREHSTPVELPFKKDSRMPKDYIQEQVVEILEGYRRGECCHSVIGAQLKDEPREIEKVLAGKTRVFAMSSYDMTLVNRMYLMPFYSLMCQHRDCFYTKVGINMHSKEVDDMYRSLVEFSPHIMEGDYGGFDTSMPIDIGYIANSVVYNVLNFFQYNDEALKIVAGILTDNLHPVLCLDGNLFVASGFQPSGKYATAEDNSLRGLILLIYFFADTHTKLGMGSPYNVTTEYVVTDFFKLCKPVIYGDDILCAVKPKIAKTFNNITYSKYVSVVYGMEFTNASKTSHDAPFVELSEMSFLKRKFRHSKKLNGFVGLLDKRSFLKSLMFIAPSKEISLDQQMVETVRSILYELYLYYLTDPGNEDFLLTRSKFKKELKRVTFYTMNDLEKMLPTADALLDHFRKQYNVS